MSFDDAKIVMGNIHQYVPHAIIVITGGEPLLHPQCESFIRHSLFLFDHVILTSNGSFRDDVVKMLLPYLKGNLWLQLSLDGPQSVHDRIRGEGAYNKVIHNLESLHEVSNHILISSTIGVNNYQSIPLLAKTLNQYSFNRWKMTMEIVKDPRTENMLGIEEWNNLIDMVLPVCNYRVRVQKYYDFQLMERFLEEENKPDEIVTNCGSGNHTFVINPNFSVVPCTCMNNPIGNFLSDNTQVLLSKLESFCNISPDKESACYSCKYVSICNGGCPGYSQKYFGKYNMGDIRCPIVKQRDSL